MMIIKNKKVKPSSYKNLIYIGLSSKYNGATQLEGMTIDSGDIKFTVIELMEFWEELKY